MYFPGVGYDSSKPERAADRAPAYGRLRSILLESCPAFEALVDPSDPRWLRVLARLGGLATPIWTIPGGTAPPP